jgi:hypothetical protein
MSQNRYSQLHRKLLFHWTGPLEVPVIKTPSDRSAYLELLASILGKGLRYSTPGEDDTEWIEKDEIRATRPMLCFSEWGVAESNSHSGRYGFMGLGFTRRFVMRSGGRPVVYVPNTRSDPFRKALVEVIRSARQAGATDPKLRRHADLLASYLKAYHFHRVPAKSSGDGPRAEKVRRSEVRSRPEDDHLRLDFGGIFANLEDREWRIVAKSAPAVPEHLSFAPGELAMIVFPDHQTLGHAMRHPGIVKWLARPDKPAVGLLSREMIHSL